MEKGNFDFDLQYSANDEIGRLTETFKHLTSHVKDHIIDLNKRVYVDALTSVKNKGAFYGRHRRAASPAGRKGRKARVRHRCV